MMSLSFNTAAFISTSLFSQPAGSMEETVNSPSGGSDAFLFTNGSAYLKLQNVAGYSGDTNKIFIKTCFPDLPADCLVNII